MATNDGVTLATADLTVAFARTDAFTICQPSAFTAVPVSNIAYSQDAIAGPSSTKISSLKLVNSASNATGKVHLDLTALLSRLAVGKGLTVTAVRLFYTLTAAVLTASPALAILTQTFGGASATAATPVTVATAGGTITPTPATTPTAVPTAGDVYTVDFALGTPLALNSGYQRAIAELTVPMTAGGTFHLLGASVFYTSATY